MSTVPLATAAAMSRLGEETSIAAATNRALGQAMSTASAASANSRMPAPAAAKARSLARAVPRARGISASLSWRMPSRTYDVDRLDDDRIERPEALLRQPEQAQAAEPADRQRSKEQQQGPHVENGRRKGSRYQLQPDGYHQRGKSEEKPRHENQHRRHHQQAWQADFDEQRSGHAEERARLGARGIVLDVASVRIDHRHCRARPVLHPWPAAMIIVLSRPAGEAARLPRRRGTAPWPC